MILSPNPIEGVLIVRAAVATLLGAAVGLERSPRYKDAGLRTLSLVALGACAFATAGYSVLSLHGVGDIRPDPTRIAAQVVSGVGFLGAGAIFVAGGQRVRGLTTAADIWVAAASGVLCDVGLVLTAAAVTALGLMVVGVLPADRLLAAPARDQPRGRTGPPGRP
jgi:putative Mg2+ transporter-C (MgtC) family protein